MSEPERLNRRDFFNKSAKIAAATTLGLASMNERVQAFERESNNKIPEFIIDSHIHCGGSEEWVEEMVKNYRPYNAMACVLTWVKDMDLMIDAIKDYPDLFIGYGRVNLDDPNAVREVEKFKNNNFFGMKFNSHQKNY